MDRTGADFFNAVQMMRERLGANAIPVTLPIGEGDMFAGIIDLMISKQECITKKLSEQTFDEIRIPQDLWNWQ
jgi:elongation factor G